MWAPPPIRTSLSPAAARACRKALAIFPRDYRAMTGMAEAAAWRADWKAAAEWAGKATLVSGSAMFQAALRAGVPPQRVSPMVSGVEFRFRDVTIKSLPARHESTMTMDAQFVADQAQSYLVTTAEGARIFCGGDNSLSEDLLTRGCAV